MQYGEIVSLGKHWLFCGDAQEPGVVLQKLGEERIRLILTDPPYGVGYVEGKADFVKLAAGSKVIDNDEIQTEEKYRAFTSAWLRGVTGCLDSYNAIYVFNSDLMYPALRDGIEEAGFYYSQMIVWIKNQAVIGRKDYLPQHELIAYGWHGRHKMERGKAKSVIFYPRPSRSKLHPTMKPIGLLRKLILNSTKKR